MCANTTITTLHLIGWYPDIDEFSMWLFDAVDLIYLGLGIYFFKTSFDENGLLIPSKLQIAKYTMAITYLIQWNTISYIWPFTDFWAYCLLFTIVYAFFFDFKLVLFETTGITLSLFISWFVKGGMLLPARDDYFNANIVFRLVGISLMLFAVNLLTYFGQKFLIDSAQNVVRAQSMEEANKELERAAQMKSDFLANMSHEIRTPMNAVIGMAEIAMREDLPDNARDSLTQIQKSGRNLLNIINDILDYTKIESGKMEIIPDRYEPASELNDISNILSTRVGDKKLELYVVTDTNIPHALYGDSMRIRQVLINLTNNAIKFTKEGSVRVIVNCTYTDDDNVILSYHIKDTGIGIKKEDIDKLFTSFTQVDSRRNRNEEGTGLGLAISQRLIEAMGGEIGVDSVYGEGSDFWFTVPQKIVERESDFTIDDAAHKRAIVLDTQDTRVQMFNDEVRKFDIESACIASLDEYASSDKKDYLFFEQGKYEAAVRPFLEKHPEITGAVLIDSKRDTYPAALPRMKF